MKRLQELQGSITSKITCTMWRGSTFCCAVALIGLGISLPAYGQSGIPCSQRTNLATCLISDGCYIINGACTSTLPTASGVTTAGPGTTATTTTTTGGQTQSQTQTSQGGQPPPPVVIPGPSVTPGVATIQIVPEPPAPAPWFGPAEAPVVGLEANMTGVNETEANMTAMEPGAYHMEPFIPPALNQTLNQSESALP